jgi:hypothetical protein
VPALISPSNGFGVSAIGIDRRKSKTTLLALAILFGAMGSPALHAQVLIRSGFHNGHYYEVYQAYGTNWPSASAYAQGLTYSDTTLHGHLATLTIEDEDEYVDGLRHDAVSENDLGRTEFWIGGAQSADGAEPGGGWAWVNGEGVIPGTNSGPEYANWLGGEPNNLGGNEEYLALGLQNNTFGWNDEGALGNIAGFIVEYDVPVPTTSCTGGSGCESVPGIQTITLPTTVPSNSTIAFLTYEFTDPRVAAHTCGTQSLNLFSGALKIPAYLCGSPGFLIVKTDTDFDLQSGTVLIENEVVPGNLYDCQPTDADKIQHRDVVVWQATDPTKMIENSSIAASVSSSFVGAAGEFTTGCGTSLGRSKGASFFGIGFHVDFGITYASDPLGIFQNYVTLNRYKLLLLKESVRRAVNDRAITKLSGAALTVLVDLTIYHLDRSRFVLALGDIKLFNALVKITPIKKVTGQNYAGDFESRGSNLEFNLKSKLIPNAP